MQSLRTRRPSQNKGGKLSKSSNAPATDSPAKKQSKDVRKSRVDDRIKKRMSMRYADISGPTDVSVPDMPSIPLGLRPGNRDDGSSVGRGSAAGEEGKSGRREGKERDREDPRIAEKKMLDKDDFDADACAWYDYTPET